jgi:hypothetical protein
MRPPTLYATLSPKAQRGLGLNWKARCLLAVATCAAGSVVIATAAQAARNDDKIVICHGTASETNPYVLISVDAHALEGHLDGSAPGHGKNNHPDLLFVNGVCGGIEEVGGGIE